MRRRAGRGGARGRQRRAERSAPPPRSPALYANLDFLPAASALLANLAPDQDGIVRVNAADLGDGQIVHVVAIDGDQIVVRLDRPRGEEAAAAHAAPARGARRRRSTSSSRSASSSSPSGGEAVLDDARSAQVEVYDSLASVHRLLSTICPDPSLAKFAFVLQWPKLTPDQKRELYAGHACHELHFFLFRKDPEFFARSCGRSSPTSSTRRSSTTGCWATT